MAAIAAVRITSNDNVTITLNKRGQRQLLRRAKMMSAQDLAKMYDTTVSNIRRAEFDAWSNEFTASVMDMSARCARLARA